jgi:hypothetical protein
MRQSQLLWRAMNEWRSGNDADAAQLCSADLTPEERGAVETAADAIIREVRIVAGGHTAPRRDASGE